ncbi:MAG: hypothetical protein Q9188_003877 [Gyalolechia gomerana]
MANEAIWISAAKSDVHLENKSKTPKPGPGQVLVKVTCIAFSPIDYKIQNSFGGIVESVGPSVDTLEPGDIIATIRPPAQLGNPDFGAFQKYALANAKSSSKVPPSVPVAEAAATILNLASVVSALSIHLKLSRPPLDGEEAKPPEGQKKVLIYGGSSSCGGLAIKYAVTAGYTVITTSSPQNRAFVASLGPAYIVDHTLPSLSVLAELKSRGPFDAILDTIGLAPITDIISEYLFSLGGGAYNSLIPPVGNKPIPTSVERRFAPYNWALEEEANKHISRWFFDEYLPQGLATGLIVPTRQHVLGGGLGKVQEALDLMHQGGISGHKLIMDPWAQQ